MEENKQTKDAIQWERVHKRLIRHAFIISGLATTAGDEYVIGAGKSAEDLASQVFTDYQTGKIPHAPEKPFNEAYITNLLKMVLEWRYQDLLESSAAKITDYAEDVEYMSDEGRQKGGDFFEYHRVEKAPGFKRHGMLSDPIPAPDQQARYQSMLRMLYERVKDDKELEEMVEAKCEKNLRKPSEIARHLKTSTEDINNRQKRLTRHFRDLLPPQQKERKVI